MTGPARAAAARLGAVAARLGLHVRGRMGARPGEQRFPGRPQPSGLEMEAHSAYAPGDDLRHLDWNLYGRLDTLLMRRFTAEREVVVHILVDGSASMGTPPGDGKWTATAELAIVLAAIAIGSRYAARMVILRDGAHRASLVHRRRAGIAHMAELLDAAPPSQRLDLGQALGEYAHRHTEGGAALVLSDFLLEPAALEPGVVALRRRGYTVYLLQMLGPSEMEPARALASGELVDAESGERHAVAFDADVLARYGVLLAAHQDAMRALAARHRATWASFSSETPALEIVIRDLVRLDLVRARR